MSKEKRFDGVCHQGTIITDLRVGHLAGKIKEIVEASIENERQCEALKNVITDGIYNWYKNSQVWLTGNEINEIEGNKIAN